MLLKHALLAYQTKTDSVGRTKQKQKMRFRSAQDRNKSLASNIEMTIY